MFVYNKRLAIWSEVILKLMTYCDIYLITSRSLAKFYFVMKYFNNNNNYNNNNNNYNNNNNNKNNSNNNTIYSPRERKVYSSL